VSLDALTPDMLSACEFAPSAVGLLEENVKTAQAFAMFPIALTATQSPVSESSTPAGRPTLSFASND